MDVMMAFCGMPISGLLLGMVVIYRRETSTVEIRRSLHATFASFQSHEPSCPS